MNRQKFCGSEPLDIEAIRLSPRQFVDLDTVEKLSDYAMVCELKIKRLENERNDAAILIAELQSRICDLTDCSWPASWTTLVLEIDGRKYATSEVIKNYVTTMEKALKECTRS